MRVIIVGVFDALNLIKHLTNLAIGQVQTKQILKIFHSRDEEADLLDLFPLITLKLLAPRIATVSGKVLCALDIDGHLDEPGQTPDVGSLVKNLIKHASEVVGFTPDLASHEGLG